MEMGVSVPYQCMTQKLISSAKRLVAYARVTVGWSRIEAPMGCYVEITPGFTYDGSELINPQLR